MSGGVGVWGCGGVGGWGWGGVGGWGGGGVGGRGCQEVEGSPNKTANGLQVIKKHSRIVDWWCVTADGSTTL
jgi:hypothetical protein